MECDACGAIYEWEMFFNNHRRSVHHIKVITKPKTLLTSDEKSFLRSYFNTCKTPALDQIKYLASFLDIQKESIYWWFINENKKERREKHSRQRESISMSDRESKKLEGDKEQGRTVDITSDRKKEKRGRVSKTVTFGKTINLLSSYRKHKKEGPSSKENNNGDVLQ